jgi:formylglycine-generating enzyme required for sulfatase activity
MGSSGEFSRADEQPPHRVRVDSFWMDTTEVTNAAFRRFAEATGYVTTAEKAPNLEEIAHAAGQRHDAVVREAVALVEKVASADADEGFRAFREKRTPRFSGR